MALALVSMSTFSSLLEVTCVVQIEDSRLWILVSGYITRMTNET